MNVRNLLVALAAAIVSFLVVTVLITAILDGYIWPSSIIGIPAGILSGIIAFVATLYQFRRQTADDS